MTTETYRRAPVIWLFWVLLLASVTGLYLIVRYPATPPPAEPNQAVE